MGMRTARTGTTKKARVKRSSTSMQAKSVIAGSSGTRIQKDKYDAVKRILLEVIPRSEQGIAYRELPRLVAARLPAAMMPAKGSATWLTTAVKLDLEARGLIQRLPRVTPQRVRRVESGTPQEST